jgi:hypothetical protein
MSKQFLHLSLSLSAHHQSLNPKIHPYFLCLEKEIFKNEGDANPFFQNFMGHVIGCLG